MVFVSTFSVLQVCFQELMVTIWDLSKTPRAGTFGTVAVEIICNPYINVTVYGRTKDSVHTRQQPHTQMGCLTFSDADIACHL